MTEEDATLMELRIDLLETRRAGAKSTVLEAAAPRRACRRRRGIKDVVRRSDGVNTLAVHFAVATWVASAMTGRVEICDDALVHRPVLVASADVLAFGDKTSRRCATPWMRRRSDSFSLNSSMSCRGSATAAPPIASTSLDFAIASACAVSIFVTDCSALTGILRETGMQRSPHHVHNRLRQRRVRR